MTEPAKDVHGWTRVVDRCQVCDSPDLDPVLFLGYLPPVNTMPVVGERPREQPSYPAQLLRCARCTLAQLGLVVDPRILFPPEYPYTSGTTRILRENFSELSRECPTVVPLAKQDLVVDIGSNDGTLLSNFAPLCRVQGIEPTDAGKLALARGIPTWTTFFDRAAADRVASDLGPAKVVTAANVFAHIDRVHDVVENVLRMLTDDGVFITESHYFPGLVETLQYDTIYHEHLRYYALGSLKFLLERHGLELIHARRISTHGGSIRAYAARAGRRPVRESVGEILRAEAPLQSDPEVLRTFRRRVTGSKLELLALLSGIKKRGERICGIGAPSRASTLIAYTGLDEGILDAVLEVPGSRKIGKYIPGSLIPVEDETRLFNDPPDHALLLSWHLADELMPKLRAKGYRGRFLLPLPEPRRIDGLGPVR